MTKTICIYHGNCADGFTAAWAVWKVFGDSVDFVPGFYGAPPPDVTGADVIMVDFSYKRPVMDALAVKARSILILDHHKTAEADLAGYPGPDPSADSVPWDEHLECVYQGGYAGVVAVLFDIDRSGAQLAWDFFHPGKPRPKLVDYVGDRDLWRFELPYSREIAAWVFSHDYYFMTWENLAEVVGGGGFNMAVAGGADIERKHHKDIRELLRVTRREMVIGGHRVPVANLPYTMASDAAGAMAEAAPFAACYFDRSDVRVFSLRSRGDGGLDVAEIAAGYGGGGHRNAAGFQVPRSAGRGINELGSMG
jgi:hypothetical protein